MDEEELDGVECNENNTFLVYCTRQTSVDFPTEISSRDLIGAKLLLAGWIAVAVYLITD